MAELPSYPVVYKFLTILLHDMPISYKKITFIIEEINHDIAAVTVP